MKTIINTLALCTLVVLGTACKTTWTEQDTQYLLYDIRDIASIGVPLLVEDAPEARPKLERAVAALRVLETDDQVGIDDIVGVMEAAGVEAIESPRGQIAVTSAKILIRRFTQDIDLSDAPNYRRVVTALREGIETGLRNSVTPPL